jgi:hypothetical protein
VPGALVIGILNAWGRLTGFLAAQFVQGLDGADALGPARRFIVIFRRLAQLPLASASTAEGASSGPLPASECSGPDQKSIANCNHRATVSHGTGRL